VNDATDVDGFSLTNRGPFDRALARIGRKSKAPARLVARAFAAALVIWVPLCLLALLDDRTAEGVAIPFAHDLASHVRFLLVVPILILAEASIGERTRLVMAQFINANLVSDAD
jgi:hypothetical protein